MVILRSMKFIFFTLTLVASLVACSPPPQQASPPNIVFIMTDDHSIQTMSTYDQRFISTPHLDRIGKEGVIFRNSFVSNSICAPSRAVLLTGKHSHLNGQVDNFTRFDSSQVTFPKLLQQAGYATAMIGKWHLKSQPTGFDHWDILINQGHYYNPDFIENGVQKTTEGYVTDIITDKSMQWLDSQSGDKPFCLLVHHKATHRIWMPDTALLGEFDDIDFPLPDNFFDAYEGREAAAAHVMGIARDMDLVYDLKMLDEEGEIQTPYRKYYEGIYPRMNPQQQAAWDAYYQPIIEDFKQKGLTGDELAKWKYKRYMQDYLSCVRSVDNNVGRLLAYLDEKGLAENTVVVYTSDQGFYMGEHGWFDKRFMYEESLRTPLVMRFPKGFGQVGEVTHLVQNIDYAPTLLDLAGVAIPSSMQGLSLLPLLTHQDTAWREAIYYHYLEFPNEHGTKKHYGIRTDRYKLIHFYEDIDVWELFDLQTDPQEMHNLIAAPEHAERIVQLKTELAKLQAAYGEPAIR